MSSKNPPADKSNSAQTQPPKATDQHTAKKKAKIRKKGKWDNVDVDGEITKGRFKYIKFTDDDDGLETYWISPE
jgi:hypothetical protein